MRYLASSAVKVTQGHRVVDTATSSDPLLRLSLLISYVVRPLLAVLSVAEPYSLEPQ